MAMIRVKLKRTIITESETEAKCGKNINEICSDKSSVCRSITRNANLSVNSLKNYKKNNSTNSSASNNSVQSVGSKIVRRLLKLS